MTRDDIIRMAREVWDTPNWNEPQIERLERFAALVAAAEREACAKVCESIAGEARVWPDMPEAKNSATVKAARAGVSYVSDECAAAIRARSKTSD